MLTQEYYLCVGDFAAEGALADTIRTHRSSSVDEVGLWQLVVAQHKIPAAKCKRCIAYGSLFQPVDQMRMPISHAGKKVASKQ